MKDHRRYHETGPGSRIYSDWLTGIAWILPAEHNISSSGDCEGEWSMPAGAYE